MKKPNLTKYKPVTLKTVEPVIQGNKKLVKQRKTMILYEIRVERKRDGVRILIGQRFLGTKNNNLLPYIFNSRPVTHTSDHDP